VTSRPPPAVPPDIYTVEYYLNCASGFDRYEASMGLDLPAPEADLLRRAEVCDGMRVLDVGSGRGEVVFNAAKSGATAVGIDYASAALSLARGMLGKHPEIRDRVLFLHGDARCMPLVSAGFDRAFMLDVVEHLLPEELNQALSEVRRVLRPGGVLYVHTMPNVRFYRYAYPVLRLLAGVAQRKHLPRDPRSQYERDMHVNEQSARSLRRSLVAAGFEVELWFSDFVRSPLDPGPLDRVVRAVGRRPPFRPVATFNVFAHAQRPF